MSRCNFATPSHQISTGLGPLQYMFGVVIRAIVVTLPQSVDTLRLNSPARRNISEAVSITTKQRRMHRLQLRYSAGDAFRWTTVGEYCGDLNLTQCCKCVD